MPLWKLPEAEGFCFKINTALFRIPKRPKLPGLWIFDSYNVQLHTCIFVGLIPPPCGRLNTNKVLILKLLNATSKLYNIYTILN